MIHSDQFRRQKAIRIADAINITGGVPVQPDAKRLSAEWAQGKISSTEMIQKLIAKHSRVAGTGNE